MSKVFLVVGMHRSATSLVAKGLHDSGVNMGKRLLGGSASNPHGHYECRDAIDINDELLRCCGGDWKNPQQVPDGPVAEVAEYVASRTHDMWGIKDPRLAITWPAWLPHLVEHDLHVICVWRDREQIAQSLQRRNSMDLERGRRLADIYHESMRRLTEKQVELWRLPTRRSDS